MVSQGKNVANPDGLASILTKDERKSACRKHGSANSFHPNQNGLIYTDSNIENLLFTRFIGKKERMAGNRTKGPKKRTDQNDADFLKALLLCVG